MKKIKCKVSRILSSPKRERDGHLSGTDVAISLEQPTREYWRSGSLLLSYLALLQVGFALPSMSPYWR